MNGFIFKKKLLPLSLLSAMLLTTVTFASDISNNSDKIYNTELGCMSCHQMSSTKSNHPKKKDQHKSHIENTSVVPIR